MDTLNQNQNTAGAASQYALLLNRESVKYLSPDAYQLIYIPRYLYSCSLTSV